LELRKSGLALLERAAAVAGTHGRTALGGARNLVGKLNPLLAAPIPYRPAGTPRVLVLGIYMAQRANSAAHLASAFRSSAACHVEQRWIGLGGSHEDECVRRVTVQVVQGNTPKFSILNRVISAADLSQFDFVIVSDDDIRVRCGFIDSFIGCQQHFDFSIAQPARTMNSFNDHAVVRRRLGSRARLTWFVEIGPLFSLRRDAMHLLMPFDEASPMGYGYDLIWPTVIRKAEKRMGIVDCCPIDHSLRKRGATYRSDQHIEAMQRYLAEREHQSYTDAMLTVRRLR
jgi:hypothetical protein